jgi:hypothetical protein
MQNIPKYSTRGKAEMGSTITIPFFNKKCLIQNTTEEYNIPSKIKNIPSPFINYVLTTI